VSPKLDSPRARQHILSSINWRFIGHDENNFKTLERKKKLRLKKFFRTLDEENEKIVLSSLADELKAAISDEIKKLETDPMERSPNIIDIETSAQAIRNIKIFDGDAEFLSKIASLSEKSNSLRLPSRPRLRPPPQFRQTQLSTQLINHSRQVPNKYRNLNEHVSFLESGSRRSLDWDKKDALSPNYEEQLRNMDIGKYFKLSVFLSINSIIAIDTHSHIYRYITENGFRSPKCLNRVADVRSLLANNNVKRTAAINNHSNTSHLSPNEQSQSAGGANPGSHFTSSPLHLPTHLQQRLHQSPHSHLHPGGHSVAPSVTLPLVDPRSHTHPVLHPSMSSSGSNTAPGVVHHSPVEHNQVMPFSPIADKSSSSSSPRLNSQIRSGSGRQHSVRFS